MVEEQIDMLTTTTSTPSSSSESTMLHRVPSKSDFSVKSSCGDLQSRLKVRKVLGVGDASGSLCSSKISQILGQSDNFIFQSPPKLTHWLLFLTIFSGCFAVTGVLCPSCLHFILPGSLESIRHLATTYAFLAAILGLTLRSGDKTSVQLVLQSLVLFHGLSLLIALGLLRSSHTKVKSLIAVLLHLFSLSVDIHFSRSINRTGSSSSSSFFRYEKLRAYLNSMMLFPSTVDHTSDHESS